MIHLCDSFGCEQWAQTFLYRDRHNLLDDDSWYLCLPHFCDYVNSFLSAGAAWDEQFIW